MACFCMVEEETPIFVSPVRFELCILLKDKEYHMACFCMVEEETPIFVSPVRFELTSTVSSNSDFPAVSTLGTIS